MGYPVGDRVSTGIYHEWRTRKSVYVLNSFTGKRNFTKLNKLQRYIETKFFPLLVRPFIEYE